MRKLLLAASAAILVQFSVPAMAGENALRYASAGDIYGLDPQSTTDSFSINFLMHIYEPLVRYNKELKIEPALATSWEVVKPDVIRYTLRQGVKFHDGSDFTADDVVMSLMRATDAIGAKFEMVVFESPDENRAAFFAGRCEAISSDRSDLASIRAVANNPDDYIVLPETISKEPLAPAVRQNDSNWRDIMSWSVWLLMAAEEKGITQANVDEMLKSQDPDIQRMLGVTDELGAMLGLDNKWGYNVIKAVGNYGEIFERNLGEGTRLGLTRGPNAQWNAGGLVYAPPFR